MQQIDFVYFGGEPLGVPVLKELEAAGLLPSLVVCNPDRPSGRGQKLTPPPVKVWAETRGIEVFQPNTHKNEATKARLTERDWDLFVVVAYNFILPQWLLAIPRHHVINVHPSLLPKLRGASPIRTAIKDNLPDQIGVSIMLMDAEMDHGPILKQLKMPIDDTTWPLPGPTLDTLLAHAGGALLAETLVEWVGGALEPREQDHTQATYCSKLEKSERELRIDPHALPRGEAARQAWHYINAFAGIGDTYFVHQSNRVKINQAMFTDGTLTLTQVTPEGKSPMPFTQYLQSITSVSE